MSATPNSIAPPRPLSALTLGALGLACTFVALGLGRFSFTPLMPMLVSEGTATELGVNQAAAVMMLGYTLGAFTAAWAGKAFGARRVVRLALLSIAVCLGIEALGLPLWGHGASRFICGAAGAFLIILAPSLLLQNASPTSRATVAGMIYSGIGLGTLVSGALVPWAGTVTLASLALAVLAGVAMISSLWLPNTPPNAAPPQHADSDDADSQAPTGKSSWLAGLAKGSPVVGMIALAYGLDAFAYVPHTAFWGTFVAQEVGLGVTVAGTHWVLFGFGAMVGPILLARVAGNYGFRVTLCGVMLLKSLAILLPWITTAPWALMVSIGLVGAFVPSTVALTSGRLAELDTMRMPARWGLATSAFALAQAAGGWVHSGLYAQFGSYVPLFPIAAAVLACGSLLIWLAKERDE